MYDSSVLGGGNSVWNGNVVVNGGGAILIHEGRLSVTDCRFVGNDETYGGAIAADGISTMHLMGDMVFTDNAASDT